MRIANRRLQILAFVLENFLNLFLQSVLLCADFRTQSKERTSEHTAAFGLDFLLKTAAVFAVSPKPFQRRNRRRKERVQFCSLALPLLIDCDHSEVGLGIEKVIETSFFHPCLLANLINRRAAIGTRPDQLPDSFHQSLFGIAYSTHKTSFQSLFKQRHQSNQLD